VGRDYVQAYAWLSLAARSGIREAVDALATVKTYMEPRDVDSATKLAGTLEAPPPPVMSVMQAASDMTAQQDSAVLRHPVDDFQASDLAPISPDAVRGAIPLPPLDLLQAAPAADRQPTPSVKPALPPAAAPRDAEYRAQFATVASEREAQALKDDLLGKHGKLFGDAGVEVETLQSDGSQPATYRVRSGLLAGEASAKAICAGLEASQIPCQPAKRVKIPIAARTDMDTGPAPVAVAKSPPVEDAAPAPANPPPAEVAEPGGPWRVQVAAGRTEEEARFRWSRLMGTHADLLDAAELYIFKADLGDKGVFYRVQIGGFDARPAAVSFCERLKARKVECFVTPTPH
jgi:hypothetical protein